jgi:hypothetical protein
MAISSCLSITLCQVLYVSPSLLLRYSTMKDGSSRYLLGDRQAPNDCRWTDITHIAEGTRIFNLIVVRNSPPWNKKVFSVNHRFMYLYLTKCPVPKTVSTRLATGNRATGIFQALLFLFRNPDSRSLSSTQHKNYR